MTAAALYLRQSLDVSEGIDRQQLRCVQLAESRGWDVVAEYVDNDVSASKPRGAGTAWHRLIRDVESGRVDVVVAVDQDRLLRGISDLGTLLELGVKIATVDGEVDLTTADGEFRATMLAGIARFEVRRKAERQRRANLHRVSLGRTSTAPRQRPFGFERDGVQVRESEAAAIREGYRMVIGGGSLAAVARSWNEAGFTTSRGKDWGSGAVSMVLASPRYMGKVSYHREVAGDAIWDTVVDEATWRTARAVLGVGRSGKPGPGRTLLGLLAYCGVCGDETRVRGGSNNGRRSYRCNGTVQHLSRKAEPVEEWIEELAKARWARSDVAQLEHEQPDVSPLVEEADQLRTRLDALAVEFADGHLTASQLRAATERLRERLDAVEADMVSAVEGSGVAQLRPGQSADAAWESLSMDERRELVNSLMRVTLLPAPRGVHGFDRLSVRVEWLPLTD